MSDPRSEPHGDDPQSDPSILNDSSVDGETQAERPSGQQSSSHGADQTRHDFGVPDSGPVEAGRSPDERPGDPSAGSSVDPSAGHTQPIETGSWHGAGDVAEHWWSSPSTATQGDGPGLNPGEQPGYGPQGYGEQPYGQAAYGSEWSGQQTYPQYESTAYTQPVPYPAGASTPTPPPSRPGRGVAGIAALALLCGLIGGGAVVGAERYLGRGTSLGSALPAPGPGSTARPDGSIAKIAANALPSVVTIKIKSAQGSGTGSGFVIDRQGHILTNNHVVAAAGDAGTITVELNNGKTLAATVVGKDASYDLAVLKVDTTDLVPLEFGRSVDVVVGDGVIAVGAPLGLDATVTSGIVSALNRPVTPGDGNDQSFINAIQTDAAINPGNSGGPLLDMNGRVIGVNSAIARVPGSASGTGGNIGVGFSIPSDQAAKTAQQLIATGKAEHPVLGVRVDRSFDGDGAKVAQDNGVEPGSSADKAGLKNGDVVVEFEARKVTDADSLIVSIRAKSVGDTVRLVVLRDGKTIPLTMTLQAAIG